MTRPCVVAIVLLAVAASCTAATVLDNHGAESLRQQHMTAIALAKENPMAQFQNWVTQHAKDYAHDVQELGKRFLIWAENLEYILAYNARHTTHWLTLNSLADLTQQEYAQRFLGFDGAAHQRLRAAKRASNSISSFKYADVNEGALPRAVDWRVLKAVTEVKNQQQCGSCWAFSTTGAVEGVNAVFSRELVSLSEQELVDCDQDRDSGCRGGLMDYAFQFIVDNKGIDTEAHYPYTGEEGQCKKVHRRHHAVTIDGFEDVPENDESALRKAVAHQPVSVAIEADQRAFQLYGGGVFSDESCGTELDHGVLVVGYGTVETGPGAGNAYWVVKNSWGADWGEHGYIRIRAGVSAKTGLCGIAMAASYPLKTTPNPPPSNRPDAPEPTPSPPKPAGPKPGPVKCDDSSECPEASTCCCLTELFNMCLQWGCCPVAGATCCKDKQHCCPPTLPVCDGVTSQCKPAAGQVGQSVPWLNKLPAQRTWPSFVDRLRVRQQQHKQQGGGAAAAQ